MRTAIAATFALLIIGLVVGAYWQGRSDGFAAHEAAAQQHALAVSKQSLATEERLHGETKAELADVREHADGEIAAIRDAEAKAREDAAAHAARADHAEASSDMAWELVTQLEAAELDCPAPQPGDACYLLCIPPELPE